MILLILSGMFMGKINIQEMQVFKDENTALQIKNLEKRKLNYWTGTKNSFITFKDLKIIRNVTKIKVLQEFYNFKDFYSSIPSETSLILHIQRNLIYEHIQDLCNFIAPKILEPIKSLYKFDQNLIQIELNKFNNDAIDINDTTYELKKCLDYLNNLLLILRIAKIQANKDVKSLMGSYILEAPIALDIYDKKDKLLGKMYFSRFWFPGFMEDNYLYNGIKNIATDVNYYLSEIDIDKLTNLVDNSKILYSTTWKLRT